MPAPVKDLLVLERTKTANGDPFSKYGILLSKSGPGVWIRLCRTRQPVVYATYSTVPILPCPPYCCIPFHNTSATRLSYPKLGYTVYPINLPDDLHLLRSLHHILSNLSPRMYARRIVTGPFHSIAGHCGAGRGRTFSPGPGAKERGTPQASLRILTCNPCNLLVSGLFFVQVRPFAGAGCHILH